MKFRFAMEFISEMEKNKSFRTVLNDSIPEEGFPSGMYNDIKFRYLNLMAATEYAAYRTLSVNYPDPENEDLKKGINTDSDYLWDAGKGRGEILTIENSAGVIRRTIKKVLFPFQKNISSIAGDVKVYRFGSTLISPEQIEEMKTKLLPGDILLERREWYLTNIGIPGFWTHAALYVGTPEERKKYFSSGIEKLLSDNSASDFEDLLNKKYGDAYGQSVNSSEPGHVPRIIEAISEGVVFTTIEHSASCDSIAALRTNLDKATIAKTILRAFHYSGRPYDFDFDFITDSKLVCTELVYKSFESENGNNPINFKMSSVAGRRMLTANGIAETCSKSDKENNSLSLVFFYDGMEFRKKSVKSDYAEFKKSISRAKWDIFK